MVSDKKVFEEFACTSTCKKSGPGIEPKFTQGQSLNDLGWDSFDNVLCIPCAQGN